MKFKFFLFLLFFIISANVFSQPQPYPGGSGKYTKLVWQDEFDGEGLPDSTRWSYEKGYLRNKELQYYVAGRLENTQVKDGFLYIRALNDFGYVDDGKKPITSASINTKGKGDWKYGRIEVRAKLPSCLGSWPAIWMIPTDEVYGGWPHSGEIDIMEHVGFVPDSIYFNIHCSEYNHVKKTGKGTSHYSVDASANFHVYAIEWFNDRIDWYFDDVKVFTFKNENTGPETWPFDQRFYLIINFAFGGAWGGLAGIDVNALPQEYLIDYVRVFQ